MREIVFKLIVACFLLVPQQVFLTAAFEPNSISILETCLIGKGLNPRNIIIRNRRSTRNVYNNLNYQWNKLPTVKKPSAYILPENTADVRHSVFCARLSKIPIVAKGGGNSYENYSFGNRKTVIIDMRNFIEITVDSRTRTAMVGPGNLNGRVSTELLRYGFLLPPGLCPPVGISFALGGGYSLLTRQYGMVLDSLLEVDMVDSSGFLITANSRQNSDLFWALRGGGSSGSFGIVTRFKFKVYPIPKTILYARISYPAAMFPQVFDAFQRYCEENPPKDMNFILTTNQTKNLVELLQVFPQGATYDSARFMRIISTKFPFTNSTTVQVLSYAEFTTVGAYGEPNSNIANASRMDYKPTYFKGKSFFVRSQIGPLVIQKINSMVQRVPKFIVLEFQANGGAIADVGQRETAYVHRGQNLYKIGTDYMGPIDQTQTEVKAALNWLREFFQMTKGLLNHTESYQNNSDEDMVDFLERYYRQNLRRLKKIKRKYDPENYFRYPQSIPPV